ncbi:hypothetical protein, partial [Nostoc sp.]|uniref:hypothetical protein n=1 Tax=Nostoc sp. TaxID=1180 RepID=UPI002FFB73BA
DYILSLKDNHPTLHQQVKNWFEAAQSIGFKDSQWFINLRRAVLDRLLTANCDRSRHFQKLTLSLDSIRLVD